MEKESTIPAGGFSSRIELETWLSSLPSSQSIHFSRSISLICSYRALFTLGSPISHYQILRELPLYLISNILRSVLISRFTPRPAKMNSGIGPKTEWHSALFSLEHAITEADPEQSISTANRLEAVTNSKVDRVTTLLVARSAALAASSALISALHSNVETVISCAGDAITAEISAVVFRNQSSSVIFGSTRPDNDVREIEWAAVTADARALEAGATPEEMAARPLWPEDSPYKPQFDRKTFLAAAPSFEVWLDWYEPIVDGKAPWGLPRDIANKLEERIALGDGRGEGGKDFWERDADIVNTEIKGWVDAARAEVAAASTPRLGAQEVEEPKRDFFISYSTKNEKMAREVNEVVTKAGFSTYVQFKDFYTGSNLVREMQRGLENSHRLIALYSPAYEASDHCQAEWAYAYNRDPGSEKGTLVPFLLEPTELNALAQQIVYSNLVGMNEMERREAIIKAIKYKPRSRSKSEILQTLKDAATPIPVLANRNGKETIGLGINPALDKPVSRADLLELPKLLIAICTALIAALPANAPPVIKPCIEQYQVHLVQRGSQPYTDLLRVFAGAAQKEFVSAEFAVWGAGLDNLLQDFFSKHILFITHFPLPIEREHILAETPIDEFKATGKTLIEPISEAVEALEQLSAAGLTEPNFDQYLRSLNPEAIAISKIQPELGDEALPSTIVTAKRRFIMKSIGFLERVWSFIGSTVSIAATSAGIAAIDTLRMAIDKLIALFL